MKSVREESQDASDNSSINKTSLEQLNVEDKKLLSSLSSDNQETALKICEAMEIPLARVVKAFNIWDGNKEKTAVHLLAMKDLLELGFEEDKIQDALKNCNNDKNRALHLLSDGHFLKP